MASQLTKENTKYVVNKPIDLGGKTITFPKGAKVVFKGSGRISNGKIIGNETSLTNPSLKNVSFGGHFLNTKLTITDEFDGETDFWGMVQAFPNTEIVLLKNITLSTSKANSIDASNFHLDGKGHTVTVQRIPVLKNTDIRIVNTIFDCQSTTERVIYGQGQDAGKAFVLKNCSFINVPEVNTVFSKSYNNVEIENCQISGMLKEESKSTVKNIIQIRLHSCTGKSVVRNNTVTNCYGTGIAGQYFNPDDNTNVLVENNLIDNVTGGGIIFVSGAVRNAVVRGNRISRTHSHGIQFEGEINGGPSSAINFHGFFNALVENNIIENCPNSSCFDFDGSLKGRDDIVKGTGLKVRGNKVTGSGPAAFFVIERVDFTDNQIEGSETYETGAAVMVMGARDVTLSRNDFKYTSLTDKPMYPIYLKDAGSITSGKVEINDNSISSDKDHLVYVHQNYTGECHMNGNDIKNTRNPNKTLEVVNKSKARIIDNNIGKKYNKR